MNVLAIDTCFDACSAAAGRGLRTLTPSISFISETMQKGHAERLLPMIETVMAEARLSFDSLDRIAVTFGPGTFTGTRICVSAARAFGLACSAEFVTLSSLKLMAMSHRIPAAKTPWLAVATDARRDEVYFEVFDRHSLATFVEPCCVSVGEAARMISGHGVTIVGSGANVVATAARDAGIDAEAILPDLLPDALDMLFPAVEMPVTKSVQPLYLRAPDAKPPPPSSLFGLPA